MAISYIYFGEPMNGTVNDDFVIGTNGSNTVNAGNGDDLVIGDNGTIWIPDGALLNGTIGTALDMEAILGTWTTSVNEMFGDGTIPHATAIVEASIGQSEYFRVAIGAGQTITVDIDFGATTSIGSPRDLIVELRDSLGNLLVTADDSNFMDGGKGSFRSSATSSFTLDPYLTHTAASAGFYYINVRPFAGGPGSTFTENNTFVMNVSVTGHAVGANGVQSGDNINGGEGNDALFGQGGSDFITGEGGDDLIDSGSESDLVYGGEGNDTLYGGDLTEESVHGDNGNDTLYSGGEGHYYGDAGNDIIYAGFTSAVNEVLDGGADVDTIDTTSWSGNYTLNLVSGATNYGEIFINFENVVAGAGNDTITGTAGANDINTQGGVDTLIGAAGNDTLTGGAGGDSLDGGADVDTASYLTSPGGITISRSNPGLNTGDANGDTYTSIEIFKLSPYNDIFYGSGGQNVVFGGDGVDLLLVNVGITLSNDYFYGEGGTDSLYGGPWVDQLSGGAGADIYNYENFFDGGGPGDTITDFEHGVDRFYLYTSLAKISPFSGTVGQTMVDGFNFIGGPAPTVTNAVGTMLYYSNLGILTWDPDGTGAIGQVLIAQLPVGTVVTGSDFLFV